MQTIRAGDAGGTMKVANRIHAAALDDTNRLFTVPGATPPAQTPARP
jgi:hypothetical protein